MIVGSEKASTMLGVLFDKETDEPKCRLQHPNPTFDADGTRFVDRKTQSGSVYAYELLGAYNETISNPAKMVYSQQFKSTNLNELDLLWQCSCIQSQQSIDWCKNRHRH